MKNFVTLDDINDVIELFEEFLDDKGIVIQNDEKAEDPGASNIYGTDYGDLQWQLLNLFEDWECNGKVNNVMNSWSGEIEEGE